MVRAADRRGPANRAAFGLRLDDASDPAGKPKFGSGREAPTRSGGSPSETRPWRSGRGNSGYWGIPPAIHAAIASMSAFAIGPAGGIEPFRIDVRDREAFAFTFA